MIHGKFQASLGSIARLSEMKKSMCIEEWGTYSLVGDCLSLGSSSTAEKKKKNGRKKEKGKGKKRLAAKPDDQSSVSRAYLEN